MTKQETIEIKGFSILLMMFYHLFNRTENVLLCNDIVIKGESLCGILARASNPVFFFLFLSGYGLYITNHNVNGDKNRYNRILALLTTYWLTLLIFVPIGFLIGKIDIPNNISVILENITAYKVTYNYEVWFLFPYILLSLLAPIIVLFVDRVGTIISLIFGCITMISTMCIFHYVGETNIRIQCYYLFNFVMLLHFLFPFLVGCCYAKYGLEGKHSLPVVEKVLNRKILHNDKFYLTFLVFLVFIRCYYYKVFPQALYVFGFIWGFRHIRLNKNLQSLLLIYGRHSTTIWFVHTYFCYYYFHDQIYSLKYPCLIFVALSVISLITSVAIDSVKKYIVCKTNSLFKINA